MRKGFQHQSHVAAVTNQGETWKLQTYPRDKQHRETYIDVKELLRVVQTLHTDLNPSPIVSVPAVAIEALAGLQRADSRVELGSQSGAWSLQDPV